MTRLCQVGGGRTRLFPHAPDSPGNPAAALGEWDAGTVHHVPADLPLGNCVPQMIKSNRKFMRRLSELTTLRNLGENHFGRGEIFSIPSKCNCGSAGCKAMLHLDELPGTSWIRLLSLPNRASCLPRFNTIQNGLHLVPALSGHASQNTKEPHILLSDAFDRRLCRFRSQSSSILGSTPLLPLFPSLPSFVMWKKDTQ